MAVTRTQVRAARLHEHGRPLEIELVELPAPAEDEVVVELEFGGVNPIDSYIAAGRVAPDAVLPRTLGGEAAGTADGHPVLVAGGGLGSTRDGVWAGAAVVPRTTVLQLPDGVGTREAAAMGVAGLTAWNCVREVAKVGAQDRVIVLGASGGVGSMIVSLARAAGATVWGQTGSAEKLDLIREQGAEHVIMADADALADALSEFEPTVAFDPLGDGFVAPALESLAVRGRFVSFGTSAGPEGMLNMQTVYRNMITVFGYGGMQLRTEERRAGLQSALTALRDGELRVQIDETLALEEVNETFERIAQRKVGGKLLLDLAG